MRLPRIMEQPEEREIDIPGQWEGSEVMPRLGSVAAGPGGPRKESNPDIRWN